MVLWKEIVGRHHDLIDFGQKITKDGQSSDGLQFVRVECFSFLSEELQEGQGATSRPSSASKFVIPPVEILKFDGDYPGSGYDSTKFSWNSSAIKTVAMQ